MVIRFKNKTQGHVEVVQDENEDTGVRDEPYQVAPSIDLKKNSNFHVFDDSLVDVDALKLNVVLSSSRQANVDEDDDDIHIEDCDEADDYSIDNEEEENSD